MPRPTTFLLTAGAMAGAAAKLARRGQLSTYLRSLKASQKVVLLNLFLSLHRDADRRRLQQLAWRVMWHRLYNDLDFERLPWTRFRVSGLQHLERSLEDGRGAILCTQHLGPYRRIFYELVCRGFRVNLLANARTSQTLGLLEARQRRYRSDRDDPRALERLALLNAEKPGSVREIFDALARNEIVLVYLDGNTGVGGPGSAARVHANNVEVSFFGQQITVRRGVCQISYHKQVPVVPLFAHWEPGHRAAMELRQPILPRHEMSVDEFCAEGMQQLFRSAEEAIRARPEQFEEWLRLHRWRARPAAATPDADEVAEIRQQLEDGGAKARRYRVDPARVLLLSMDDGEILADARNSALIKPGQLLRDVVHTLARELSLADLLDRLGSRYPRPEVLDAVAQLKALELLTEAAG